MEEHKRREEFVAHRRHSQAGVVKTPRAIDGRSCVDSHEHRTDSKCQAYCRCDGDEAAMVRGRNDGGRGNCRVRHDESIAASA